MSSARHFALALTGALGAFAVAVAVLFTVPSANQTRVNMAIALLESGKFDSYCDGFCVNFQWKGKTYNIVRHDHDTPRTKLTIITYEAEVDGVEVVRHR